MQFTNISELIEILKRLDSEYHTDGNSSVSDAEYDKLRRIALNMDPGNAYFSSVGSDVRSGKEKLPYTMGSLDQKFDGEVTRWIASYDLENEDIVLSDKLDGISCLSIYRYGNFEKAFSRGNGIEGADISRHVRKVPSFPMKLKNSTKAYAAVRGELIMPNGVFRDKFSQQFKNPRNMVAGCFNRSTTTQDILDCIDFVTYQVVEHSDIDGPAIDTKIHELDFLAREGFLVVPYTVLKGRDIEDKMLTEYTKEVAKVSARVGYELDGIVMTINKYNVDDHSIRKSTTLNPEHSIKYKVPKPGVKVLVVDVLWEVSKSGFFKPRVQIKPIEMGGVTITYATGFNGKFIFENGIGPGAEIMITRSGDVIPYITEVITPATPKMPDEDYEWNESRTEIIVVDDNNPVVKFKQVLSFVETLQVELLKESTLAEVFAKKNFDKYSYAEIIGTLFDMSPGEWVKVVGANGKKIADSLRRRGENMTHEIFLGAVKYLGFGFGVRKAKALLSQISYEDLKVATITDIANLDGFDVTTAARIVKGMRETDALLANLIAVDFISIVKEVKTSELKGLNVVFTGFRDPELEKTIEGAGGKVGSSVSSKTTHLLTTDPTSNSGKAKKARDLGVTVMSPDQFKDEFNL